MKKNVLLILIILLTTHLFGQIGKGDVFISVNGSYSKNYSGSGVTTNQFSTDGKYLESGTSVEYFLTDRLSAGVGLDYQWSKENKSSYMYLQLSDGNFSHYQEMDTRSHTFLPNIFLKHYLPISSKLYFNTGLQLSYGKFKSEYTTAVADLNFNEFGSPNHYSYSGDSQVDYFAAYLGPELTYFICPYFVGCLSMGGVEYGMFDWDVDNSVWTVNFNPVNWKLGFKIKL